MSKANKRFRLGKNDKAEMGIGTMIIFIALVIVAAMAATLLISTAQWVQQQAQETGKTAIADVATGVQIIHIEGDTETAGGDGEIDQIYIKTELMAGSPAINLSDVLIEITDGTTDITLIYSDTAASATEFTVLEGDLTTVGLLRDMDGDFDATNKPVAETGDVICFHIDATAAGLDLQTQTHVELKIIPKHGVPTFETFDTPAVYGDQYMQLV